MSDRTLYEISRAYEQTIRRLEGRLARVELRAFPGAVRSAGLAVFVGTIEIPQTVVSLKLSSGRWIILHRGYCTSTKPALGASLSLHSLTSTQSIMNTPFVSGWEWGTASLPFCDYGEVTLEEADTINLQVYADGFETVTWTALSLLAIPV